MNRNIELIRYVRFGEDLLMLEQVNTASAPTGAQISSSGAAASTENKTVAQYLAEADRQTTDLYDALKEYLLNMGDDVQFKTLKFYFAFKRIKNFACVEIIKSGQAVRVHVKVDPDTIGVEPGFTRDVRKAGHSGTGDLEIIIRSLEDLERAKPLLLRSYENA